jgi:hypothetical protein
MLVHPYHLSGFFIYFMDTRTIERVQNFANQIERKIHCSKKDAFNLAIQMWKADSLDTIAEALKVDGDISQSLSDISKAIKKEL